MSNTLEILRELERERRKNKSRNTGDRRFGKCPMGSKNSYARVLDEPGVKERIEKAVADGECLHKIFTELVERGVLTGDDYSAFYRAYQRRSGVKPKRRGEKEETQAKPAVSESRQPSQQKNNDWHQAMPKQDRKDV